VWNLIQAWPSQKNCFTEALQIRLLGNFSVDNYAMLVASFEVIINQI